MNCLMSAEWISPSKIICRTGLIQGKGDVIVQTRSAGVGTSTVTFAGYMVQVGPVQDSAVWIDESRVTDARFPAVHRPSSPGLLEEENPLGLADDGTRGQIGHEELMELFPQGSDNIEADDFLPVRFLLQNHQGTSFDDLKAGLQYLKRISEQRSGGPLAFMKANVSAFMDCQDSLTAMHTKLEGDDVLGSPSICSNLQEILERCNDNADKLFQDVLNRKDKADSTRNALNVLNRFKFLFNLPITMERNIQRGDYEIVVNDYERAKSLFSNTEVQVFKKVYQEVESRVSELRKQLKEQLMALPATLDDQKKIIRYLVDLECGGDPAWECIQNQKKWLTELLLQCKDEYLQVEKFDSPHKVAFLEDLVEIMEDTIPEFWKLGQAYCSGELYAESGLKFVQSDTNRGTLFKKMMSEVLRCFAYLVRAAFLPQTLIKLRQEERQKFGIWKPEKTQDSSCAWLPHCVRIMRSLLSSFNSLDMPTEPLHHVQNLTLALRSHCMTSVFQQATEDIKALYRRETWSLQVDENSGITTLPLLYENIVIETVQLLKEVVVEWKAGAADIFKDPAVQKQTSRLSIEMLKAFATCLEQLTFKTDVEADSQQENQLSYMDSALTVENLPTMEERLVIVLSNCNYVANQVITRLREHFEKNGYPDMKRVETTVQVAFSELDDKLFEAYTEQKSDPVVGLLEQGMYAGYFDWKTLQRPMGVRPYIKEAIMNVISIHAEVYAISPMFIPRIMTKIVEALAEEICRLISCVGEFSPAGALQARMELLALQESLSTYSNAASNSSFQEAFNLIPQIASGGNKKILEEELNNFKSNTRFQLACFQSDEAPALLHYQSSNR
ncbi:exocyst complex component 2-like isoform X2 [Glandiceps talaboti]